jgi:predicted HTH domain antitoxin
MAGSSSEMGTTPGGEVRLSFTVPASVLSALRRDPDGFAHELRIAAAVKWYERHLVSQGRAAEIAGVSRADFLAALDRYEVSPFQTSVQELVEEATG